MEIGVGVKMEDINPRYQAIIAIATLLEVMGLVDMVLRNAEVNEETRQVVETNWDQRMTVISEFCQYQIQEMTIFGQAFDTDKTIGEEPDV